MTGFSWGGENGATWGGDHGGSWGFGPPSPPDELEAEAVSESEVSLEWTIVGTIDAVRIYRAREESDDLADYEYVATVGAPDESYVDEDLTNGREYHYRVTAANAAGESDPSNPADATTDLPEPTLEFDTSESREIGIDVTLEDDNDEGDVTLYRAGEEIATLPLDDLEFTDDDDGDDLLDGEQYAYHAERDTGDTSVETDPEDVVAYLPDAEGLTLDASVQSELTAEWDPVLNNGRFRLEYRDDDPDGDHPDYEHVATVDHDGDFEETIEDLVDGEQYSVRLRTETDHATGEWLEASPITKLVPASDVEIVETTTSGATVEWTNESEFRGSNQVYRRRADYDYGGDAGRLVGTVAEDDEEFTDESAQPDREYEYAVRALTQWVYADSDPATAETDGIGLESRAVPPQGWYVEIDHPDRDAPLVPELLDDPQIQPTINGYPRVSFSVPPDERWLDLSLDDATVHVWKDGQKQPVDRLEHRTLSPESVELEARGGTQLDRRVVESTDIEEALAYAEYLIEEYTDYDAVVDDPDDVVREDVLLLAAAILAELQAAFEEIPDDVPLEFVDDVLRALPVAWVEWESLTGESHDDLVGGEGALVISPGTGGTGRITFDLEHDIPAGEAVIAVRSRAQDGSGDPTTVDVLLNGDTVPGGDDTTLSNDPGWDTFTVDVDVESGSNTVAVEPGDASAGWGREIDAVALYDSRFTTVDESEQVHEPGGHVEHPYEYPHRDSPARLRLDEIATPLSIVRLMLEAVSDDGEPLPELALGVDGSDDDFDTVIAALSHDLEYDDLAATANARVGLGHRDDLEPRDETPRLGYEPQALDELELRADLDETPVVVNYQRDAQLIDHLRDIVEDVADAAFEVRPGDGDETELHIARIDGRPTDVDSDLIDYSIERNTEDTVDRAVVYAGAESLRRVPFEADEGEWAELPLGDGRIVRDSETVFDAADDDETLERGEDYELRPVVIDGPPEIKLLTDVDEPRIDCDFQPRGEHERSDLPDEPREITEHAPNLSGQQMADIAAFQAVEGSYTDAVIDASITVPVDEIGWNVIDALNVAALPGDRYYQIKDGDTDPERGQFRLGAGRTGQEEIQRLDNETGQVKERV